MSERAVVLLSGGLDSTVALHLARSQGYQVHALSFSYGQRHSRELDCARWQVEAAGAANFRVVDLPFTGWDTSALVDRSVAIEPGCVQRQLAPNTYVPARNLVFLAVAASVAEALRASKIFIGVSEVDYSSYVDCRQRFIDAMQEAVNQGTERRDDGGRPIEIVAPFMRMSKAEEIRLGLRLGVDFSHTWTCYQGESHPCGRCDGCLLRAQAFEQAGVADPLA